MSEQLLEELDNLGIDAEGYVSLTDTLTPRHLRYLDLVRDSHAIEGDHQLHRYPDGVVEASGRPILYVARENSLGSGRSTDIADLVRTLACRADARYLAVVRPGKTTLYRIGFFESSEVHAPLDIENGIALRNLINGLVDDKVDHDADRTWLDDLLFSLLTETADSLRDACPAEILSDGTLLSLLGRALFTRFLADRGIIKDEDVAAITGSHDKLETLFASTDNLKATLVWLDTTFNGDLLDLGTRDYTALVQSWGEARVQIFNILSDIMYRSPGRQLALDWGGLRFRHIPVDVLSQVYEHFAHRYMPEDARRTSVHYTPRSIVEVVVDGAFSALGQGAHAARVLDPSVGAGVFLVIAFRRLVAERWYAVGKRPDRREIRDILNQQLCGLDINPESIKVAALSLYLAAIELDPDPQPLSDLRFDRLFGTTLRCVSMSELGDAKDAHLGSLAKTCPQMGTFDIVLGNPPWTGLPNSDRRFLNELASSVLSERGESVANGALVPHQWPDIAFLWKALHWCRRGGTIGMLLHARLLFSNDAFAARRSVFNHLRVTGILNGSALRQSGKVWPTVQAPFAALVAINEIPSPEDTFYFLSPRRESTLNERGEFRLDPQAAIPIALSSVTENSAILKTLFRGSALDLELVSRLRRSPRIALDTWLADHLNATLAQGFIRGNRANDASQLGHLPVFETQDELPYEVDVRRLTPLVDRYPAPKFERPRTTAIYSGPLLLFREAPKLAVERRGSIWCEDDIAYGRSYYGVAFANTDKARDIASFLYVLSYSNLFVYWVLVTSAKFGVERDTFHIEDLEGFPMVPYSELSVSQRSRIQMVAADIRKGNEPWEDIEKLVSDIYRLSESDRQLIEDALTYDLPYAPSKRRAEQSAPVASVNAFCREAERVLNLLDGKATGEIQVNAIGNLDMHGWHFFEVSRSGSLRGETPAGLVSLARRLSGPMLNSRMELQLERGHWVIGQMDRRPYWSLTAARLFALSTHEQVFVGPVQ